ncbi:MAG: phospholipid carrier-dependent glycosyltransferase [Eubacteriales bacterium]|nr:phospholipid carrier-dependent glycosyltransferase [Eubacteriales bacterium]
MFALHGIVIVVLYGLFSQYEKRRHGVSRRLRDTVLVCCLIFVLRLFLAFAMGFDGNVLDNVLADIVALFSFELWERLLKRFFSAECVPVPSAGRMPFGWKDFGIPAALCLGYGCIAFWNLGIREAPVTEYPLAAGESLILDFGENPEGTTLNWYLKDYSRCTLTLESGDSADGPWEDGQEIFMERVFCWGSCQVETAGRYLRLTNLGEAMAIGELVLQDAEGNVVTPESVVSAADVQEAGQTALFDETDTFPEVIDYRSGSYFDEGYYVRTAYEFLNGEQTYETTHPPLGKIFIALGAACFGTTPFGFRMVGVLFGVLMLPFLYLMGREMTGSRLCGTFAAFLLACDFMHFTQTRLATIDGYITFFTILMFYFMYRYSRMNFYDTPLRRTFLPLGACGVSFGLGIACKWTGFYAGVGLAVLFFRVLYLRYREYVYASRRPQGCSHGIAHGAIIRCFRKNTVKTLGFCVVFFLVVPFLIYLLSYLPFSDGTDAGLFERMWKNQNYMLRYHTGLRAEHPYASKWYQWPLMIRPVFYYTKILEGEMRQGISAFGNPLVWWAGIPALLYMLYRGLRKKDQTAIFLCIAYAACYLPWCLVTRYTFLYHYFPCVPLVICMITYSLAQWRAGGAPGRASRPGESAPAQRSAAVAVASRHGKSASVRQPAAASHPGESALAWHPADVAVVSRPGENASARHPTAVSAASRPGKGLHPRKFAALLACYALLALALFALFYPVLSGAPVSGSYVAEVLRWLDTWVLVQYW